MKTLPSLLTYTAGILLFAGTSCTKNPEACITTDKRTDRFVVNEEIHFHASCSRNAESYVWRFENKLAGPDGGTVVTRESVKFRFSRAGRHQVKLEAHNNLHTAEAYMTVYVYEN